MDAVVLCCAGRVPSGAVQAGPRPEKDTVDPYLEASRLVVIGAQADWAAVVLRLVRKEKLDTVSLALMPADCSDAEVDTALNAPARAVPLVRDDLGGVLIGLGVVDAPHATVYCDDELLLRGKARVEVRPGGAGVVVTVRRRLRPVRTGTGRAVQIGCTPTVVTRDGVAHPRKLDRCSWYRNTQDLLLAPVNFPGN